LNAFTKPSWWWFPKITCFEADSGTKKDCAVISPAGFKVSRRDRARFG